jgi:mono/diheme cytochrome c family protein
MKARALPCLLSMMLCIALPACSKESRAAANQPVTPPISDDDPRDLRFAANAYQVSQGGRYFGWYGCAGCHSHTAQGVLDLHDGVWRRGGTLTQVYGFLASGHGGGARIPAEQLWQITAYVRDLPNWPAEMRRRQDLDLAAEPQGSTWNGPSL